MHCQLSRIDDDSAIQRRSRAGFGESGKAKSWSLYDVCQRRFVISTTLLMEFVNDGLVQEHALRYVLYVCFSHMFVLACLHSCEISSERCSYLCPVVIHHVYYSRNLPVSTTYDTDACYVQQLLEHLSNRIHVNGRLHMQQETWPNVFFDVLFFNLLSLNLVTRSEISISIRV